MFVDTVAGRMQWDSMMVPKIGHERKSEFDTQQ
jgi:hypothetical protein